MTFDLRTRRDVTFESGAESCAAWFYPAAVSSRLRPVVVMAHGLSGTRRDGLGPFAEKFAEAGFAALVFDHRGFGDSAGTPDWFSPKRQAQDWRAAIAFARELEGVDPSRVVTFGSSMGGGNALRAAAKDGRVAAAVSQVPFMDIVAQAHPATLRALPRMLASALLGRHLPAVGQPGEAAFINAPDSEPGWRAVVAAGESSIWRNRVSSRWLLMPPFRPVRHARTLHCPWLVCVGEADQVAKPGPAIRAARRAPHGVVKTYPGVDHFDIYDGSHHDLLVDDQIAFLRQVFDQDAT